MEINDNSIVIENIDVTDYPDFVDATITYAEFTDGRPLNERQLERLNEEYYSNGKLYQLTLNKLI